jgi:hypothetical protein
MLSYIHDPQGFPSATSLLLFRMTNNMLMMGLQVVGMSWTEVDTMEKNMTVQRNISFTFTMDNKVWVCVCVKWRSKGEIYSERNWAVMLYQRVLNYLQRPRLIAIV